VEFAIGAKNTLADARFAKLEGRQRAGRIFFKDKEPARGA
jgi:hypothetical protein